jgi:hypothetical protein
MPKRKRVVRNRRVYAPYPELVDPNIHRGYTIYDNSEVENRESSKGALAQTDKAQRIMAVPLSVTGAEVSRHELAHAKWSPVNKPKVKDALRRGCMEGIEEARVNLGLDRLGLPFHIVTDEGRRILELLLRDMEENKLAGAAVRTIACVATNLDPAMVKILEQFKDRGNDNAEIVLGIRKKLLRKMKSARMRARSTVPTFKQGQRMARWLEKELRRECPAGSDPESQVRQVIVPSRGGTKVKPARGMPLKQAYRNAKQTQTSKGMRNWMPKTSAFFTPRWGATVPGNMEIRKPRLTIPLKSPDLERVTKARAADEGTEFRYIERFVTDQRVFKRRAKKRKGGGTVLLDVSSTMELTDGDVMRIVEGSPDATKVATYCGNSVDGELRIVVDKGKRASPEDVAFRYGIGNNVDVHALDWLSCQPEPRVWFTDGGVTGQGHECDQTYRDVCDTIVSENDIIQCRRVPDVVAALRREPVSEPGRFVYRDDQYCHRCERFKDECACCDECGYREEDCECED